MKSLLIVTLEFPPQFGGIQTYIKNLARILHTKTTVLTTPAPQSHEADVFFDDKSESYPIIRKKLLYPGFIWPRWGKAVIEIFKTAKRINPDIILTPQALPLGYALYIIKILLKKPYAINMHGLDIRLAKQSFWKSMCLKKVLNSAYFIVVNSDFTKNEVLSLAGMKNKEIVVVYPCPEALPDIDKNFIDSCTRKWAINGKTVIVSIGRLIKRKGFTKVLDVIPSIAQKYHGIVYVIAGNGPEVDKIAKKIEELKIQNYVRLLGSVTEEEKDALLRLSKIFVLPAHDDKFDVEGFGIVYLEAALRKVPSIGSKYGGVGEAIENGATGIVFGSSIEELKTAIENLLANPEFATQLGENAYRRATEEFVWKHQVQKLAKYLKN